MWIVTKLMRKNAFVGIVFHSDLRSVFTSSLINVSWRKNTFSMLYFSMCKIHVLSVTLKQQDVWDRGCVITLFVEPCSSIG